MDGTKTLFAGEEEELVERMAEAEFIHASDEERSVDLLCREEIDEHGSEVRDSSQLSHHCRQSVPS